jgi:ketosteroid isomerase-like protein
MNLKTCALRAAILSTILASFVSSLSVSAADDAKDANAANKQFYAALNAMFKGDADPMKKIWSHSKDVTYMGPDGTYEHGYDATIANWEKQATKKLGGHIDLTDPSVITGTDLAIVSGVEKGQNAKTEAVSIRATNVFRKENGAWKMIGHHTDKLSWLK